MSNALTILRRTLPLWTSAPISHELVLRTGKNVLAAADDTERHELLRRSKAGEHIELMLDVTSFKQHPTEHNRNHVRFENLAEMGRSGVNTVFLRDHKQRELDMRGGTVEASVMEEVAHGVHHLHQSIRLHEPWAIQKALTGSIDRFSIGWYATGPIFCSVCGTDILCECWHFPGDVVSVKGEEIVVEWIYQRVELVETSAVCVPAVVGTTVDDIRSALSAYTPSRTMSAGKLTSTDDRKRPTHRQSKETRMDPTVIAKILGLSDSADEKEILKALTTLRTEHTEFVGKVAKLSGDVTERDKTIVGLNTQLDGLKADKALAELDGTIASLKADARISDAQETVIRDLFTGGHTDAAHKLAESFKAAPQKVPVGKRQSLVQDDVGSNVKPGVTGLGGAIDFHSVAQELPAHIQQLGGKLLKANPRLFIEGNKHTKWAQALAIDWDGLKGQS